MSGWLRGSAYDDEDDRDAPQAIDLEGDDEEDLVECPRCGRSFYAEAPRCPGCGYWVEDNVSPAASRSRGWFWPIMVAVLVAVILVLWHGMGH
ncbi:MAG TPA: hypothetical protein VLM89_11195 [Phycisphaerae bacterium]|nr:hypothetical protein [Phycisphaerae bacterium]